VLSSGNTVATNTNAFGGVRTVIGHASGKWYFEITTTTWTGNIFDVDGLCFVTGAEALGNFPGGASLWFRNDGLAHIAGVSQGNSIDALVAATIGFAIDMNTKFAWVNNYTRGTGWVGASFSPSPDPVTGTNGFNVSSVFTGATVYPGMSGDNSTTDVATFDQTFAHAPPTGFCGW
jgi:hypothetical protein